MQRVLNGAAAAVAVGAGALFVLTLTGAGWPSWLQLVVSGALAAAAGQSYRRGGSDLARRVWWLDGYTAALADVDPAAAALADEFLRHHSSP